MVMTRVTLACFCAAQCAGCVPDLQAPVPPCLALATVPYEEAAPEFKTQELADAIAAFQSLAGTWVGTLSCAPEFGGRRPITLSLSPDTPEKIRVITGSTPNSNGAPGVDCADRGVGVAHCGLEIVDVNTDGLRGQHVVLDAQLRTASYGAVMFGDLDVSYDASLSFALVGFWLGYDGIFDGQFRFAHQPVSHSDGTTTMDGDDCRVDDLTRAPDSNGPTGAPVAP